MPRSHRTLRVAMAALLALPLIAAPAAAQSEVPELRVIDDSGLRPPDGPEPYVIDDSGLRPPTADRGVLLERRRLVPGQQTAAADRVVTATATAPTTPAADLPRAQYATLSAALVDRFSAREGTSVTAFLDANAPALPSTLAGVDVGGLDIAALDARLAGAGLTFDGQQVGSLREWSAGLASSPSIDGAVTLQAAAWAQQVANVSVPTVQMPDAPGTASLGDEALLFGLFAKESITDFIATRPDLFEQVATTGVGTPAANEAFRDTMLLTFDRLDEGLSAGLLDECGAGFMAAMASGDADSASFAGSECGGCAAAGVGANHLMNRVFDLGSGASTTLLDPLDDLVTAQDWAHVQDWVAGAIIEANPELNPTSPTPQPSASSLCNGGAADSLEQVLPDVYSGLLGP